MRCAVEAIGFYYERLWYNYNDHPCVVCVNKAVHRSMNVVDIIYVDPEKLSKFPEYAEGIGLLDPFHYKKSNVPSCCIIKENVETVHIMDLMPKSKYAEIQILQIDTEGYDAEIVKMINFALFRPKFIKFEHVHLQKDARSEVFSLLLDRKYKLY